MDAKCILNEFYQRFRIAGLAYEFQESDNDGFICTLLLPSIPPSTGTQQPQPPDSQTFQGTGISKKKAAHAAAEAAVAHLKQQGYLTAASDTAADPAVGSKRNKANEDEDPEPLEQRVLEVLAASYPTPLTAATLTKRCGDWMRKPKVNHLLYNPLSDAALVEMVEEKQTPCWRLSAATMEQLQVAMQSSDAPPGSSKTGNSCGIPMPTDAAAAAGEPVADGKLSAAVAQLLAQLTAAGMFSAPASTSAAVSVTSSGKRSRSGTAPASAVAAAAAATSSLGRSHSARQRELQQLQHRLSGGGPNSATSAPPGGPAPAVRDQDAAAAGRAQEAAAAAGCYGHGGGYGISGLPPAAAAGGGPTGNLLHQGWKRTPSNSAGWSWTSATTTSAATAATSAGAPSGAAADNQDTASSSSRQQRPPPPSGNRMSPQAGVRLGPPTAAGGGGGGAGSPWSSSRSAAGSRPASKVARTAAHPAGWGQRAAKGSPSLQPRYSPGPGLPRQQVSAGACAPSGSFLPVGGVTAETLQSALGEALRLSHLAPGEGRPGLATAAWGLQQQVLAAGNSSSRLSDPGAGVLGTVAVGGAGSEELQQLLQGLGQMTSLPTAAAAAADEGGPLGRAAAATSQVQLPGASIWTPSSSYLAASNSNGPGNSQGGSRRLGAAEVGGGASDDEVSPAVLAAAVEAACLEPVPVAAQVGKASSSSRSPGLVHTTAAAAAWQAAATPAVEARPSPAPDAAAGAAGAATGAAPAAMWATRTPAAAKVGLAVGGLTNNGAAAGDSSGKQQNPQPDVGEQWPPHPGYGPVAQTSRSSPGRPTTAAQAAAPATVAPSSNTAGPGTGVAQQAALANRPELAAGVDKAWSPMSAFGPLPAVATTPAAAAAAAAMHPAIGSSWQVVGSGDQPMLLDFPMLGVAAAGAAFSAAAAGGGASVDTTVAAAGRGVVVVAGGGDGGGGGGGAPVGPAVAAAAAVAGEAVGLKRKLPLDTPEEHERYSPRLLLQLQQQLQQQQLQQQHLQQQAAHQQRLHASSVMQQCLEQLQLAAGVDSVLAFDPSNTAAAAGEPLSDMQRSQQARQQQQQQQWQQPQQPLHAPASLGSRRRLKRHVRQLHEESASSGADEDHGAAIDGSSPRVGAQPMPPAAAAAGGDCQQQHATSWQQQELRQQHHRQQQQIQQQQHRQGEGLWGASSTNLAGEGQELAADGGVRQQQAAVSAGGPVSSECTGRGGGACSISHDGAATDVTDIDSCAVSVTLGPCNAAAGAGAGAARHQGASSSMPPAAEAAAATAPSGRVPEEQALELLSRLTLPELPSRQQPPDAGRPGDTHTGRSGHNAGADTHTGDLVMASPAAAGMPLPRDPQDHLWQLTAGLDGLGLIPGNEGHQRGPETGRAQGAKRLKPLPPQLQHEYDLRVQNVRELVLQLNVALEGLRSLQDQATSPPEQ